MWNLFPSWIPVSFFKQTQGGCKSFCIIDHLSNLLQMHFNKLGRPESNILSPFVNSLLSARLKIANSLNWKCSFCEEKRASTKGFNYWQAHFTTFFNKLSHITLIPEEICAFLIKQCVSIMAFFMTTCILCSEDMQRDDDYPSHTHCIFQDVAHRVENSPILLLSYTWRRIKDFQIPNTAEAGILKTIRWYLLFSTNGVPSNVCVWGWHLHCCDVGSCRLLNLISSSLAKAFHFSCFILFPQLWQKYFLFPEAWPKYA